jgi:hypothetical protein
MRSHKQPSDGSAVVDCLCEALVRLTLACLLPRSRDRYGVEISPPLGRFYGTVTTLWSPRAAHSH